jgi:hypothetical protein
MFRFRRQFDALAWVIASQFDFGAVPVSLSSSS